MRSILVSVLDFYKSTLCIHLQWLTCAVDFQCSIVCLCVIKSSTSNVSYFCVLALYLVQMLLAYCNERGAGCTSWKVHLYRVSVWHPKALCLSSSFWKSWPIFLTPISLYIQKEKERSSKGEKRDHLPNLNFLASSPLLSPVIVVLQSFPNHIKFS